MASEKIGLSQKNRADRNKTSGEGGGLTRTRKDPKNFWTNAPRQNADYGINESGTDLA